MISKELIESVKQGEGFRNRVYKCTGGFDTCGYGYNLEANPLLLDKAVIEAIYAKGITKQAASDLLTRCLRAIELKIPNELPWFSDLDPVRRDVLSNMAYNLGINGLLGFRNTLGYIKIGQYEKASQGMLHSKWAKQVKGRAKKLSEQMRTGKY